MAVTKLSHAARLVVLVYEFGSRCFGSCVTGPGRCHSSLASKGIYARLLSLNSISNEGSTTSAIAVSTWDQRPLHNNTFDMAGHRRMIEKMWEDFFADPSQWWDHRPDKVSTRYPDFKHKKTQEALWVDGRLTPPWVKTELDAMKPGSVQSDVFSWNARLGRCLKAGQYKQTMELFQQLQQEGTHPDRFTFVRVLNACATLGVLTDGKQIHDKIIKNGCESDLYVSSGLISMYVKCCSMEDAWQVFKKMSTRNAVSWNVMILGYMKCGQGHKALELYQQMQQEGVKPDPFTYVGSLNACASMLALEEGRSIHHQIIHRGWESHVFVGSSLVNMYSKCGSIEDAWKVFNKMPVRDVVAWSAMIQGFVRCGHGQKALDLSQQMQREGVEPDPVTFVGILNACASLPALEEGRRVHEQIVRVGYESDIFVGSSLVDMYAKCGSIEDACRVFNTMPLRDVVSWNAMILGYVKSGQGQKALELSHQMQQEGMEPVPATFVGVISACASMEALEDGRHVHEQIIQRGFESDVFVGCSLVDMYIKCGSLKDAWNVFNKMPTRNVVSWNAMISGHVKCLQSQKALELFHQMQQEDVEPDPVTFVGVLNACASLTALKEGRHVHEQIIKKNFESDVFVHNSLVDMYAKCGSMEDARRVFNTNPSHDVVAWSAIIQGYVKCGLGQKALELSRQMLQEGVEPDSVIFVGMLNACASVVALEEGRRVHEHIIQRGCESDVFVGSSLIDMYSKCGSVEESSKVFNKMPRHNVISWNAMLGCYAMHGLGKETLEHFRQMCQENVETDGVTFISLLSACSHAGLMDEGTHYFASMNSVYNVSATVEHYACMVDLLSRSGRLQEAEELINSMSCKPDTTVWMSLLSACKIHGNMEMGERIGTEILNCYPGHTAGYVLLSNIYADSV